MAPSSATFQSSFSKLKDSDVLFCTPFPKGDLCITSERFADREPVPGSLARTCPRSFGFVRVAHFAQDDAERHSLIMHRPPEGKGDRKVAGLIVPHKTGYLAAKGPR